MEKEYIIAMIGAVALIVAAFVQRGKSSGGTNTHTRVSGEKNKVNVNTPPEKKDD